METLLTKTHPSARLQGSLQEYLLVAIPDTQVCNQIMQLKQNFYDKYGQNITLECKPYVEVAKFMAREEMEETIVRYMQRILKHQENFKATLNNYSGLPPHSIYLRVQNAEVFTKLARQFNAVDNYIHSCLCPPVIPVKKPLILIARRLSELVYQKAMMDYAQKSFHESFTVNELVLIRRSHEYDTGKAVTVFRLQPSANPINLN